MSKVKLPREVAEAIDYYRSVGYMNRAILDVIEELISAPSGNILKAFVNQDDDNFDLLLQALVNGYEEEETPEDKLLKYYLDQKKVCVGGGDSHDKQYAEGAMDGVLMTLTLLNFKVEGVNV